MGGNKLVIDWLSASINEQRFFVLSFVIILLAMCYRHVIEIDLAIAFTESRRVVIDKKPIIRARTHSLLTVLSSLSIYDQ